MPNTPLTSPPENTEVTNALGNPYSKFEYIGANESLKSLPSAEDKETIKKSIEAGLNWFVPNEANSQIKITKHLYEDNAFFLKPSGSGVADVSTLYKIYEESKIDKIDDVSLKEIPFVTIVNVDDAITKTNNETTYIYNFNEPVRLSPYTIPPSIINTTNTQQPPEIIAFDGITTKYTYIFYGVNFIDTDNDTLPSKYDRYWSKNDKGVVYTPSINNFDDLVSTTNEFYETEENNVKIKKPKTGFAILKVAEGMTSFGITILTKSFEIVDPLLITLEIGKDTTALSSTDSATVGTVAGSSVTSAGVGGVCYNCDTSSKLWITRKFEFGEKSIIGEPTTKTKEALDKEKPKWWVDAKVQSLVNSLNTVNATTIKDWNVFICKKILSIEGTSQAGDAGDIPSVPAKYTSLQNSNSSPYDVASVSTAYEKVKGSESAFNGIKSQLDNAGVYVKILEEQVNPVNLYTDVLSKCYPP